MGWIISPRRFGEGPLLFAAPAEKRPGLIPKSIFNILKHLGVDIFVGRLQFNHQPVVFGRAPAAQLKRVRARGCALQVLAESIGNFLRASDINCLAGVFVVQPGQFVGGSFFCLLESLEESIRTFLGLRSYSVNGWAIWSNMACLSEPFLNSAAGQAYCQLMQGESSSHNRPKSRTLQLHSPLLQ